ncbi:MAG TPA: type II toxin-antitoxin system PemK/MazF family toxin [Acidimicrobiales bacterium]|nr:type II toxin-antitoxin system PemK/MazF family toxin [Acidimicrobiales bacterium]
MVSRGEVWWYEHPDAGRRPFAILTRTEACGVLNQVLAAPATTVIRQIPTEVPLDKHDGMPRRCVLSLDNVTLIRPALCTELITTLDAATMGKVCEALGYTTAC